METISVGDYTVGVDPQGWVTSHKGGSLLVESQSVEALLLFALLVETRKQTAYLRLLNGNADPSSATGGG